MSPLLGKLGMGAPAAPGSEPDMPDDGDDEAAEDSVPDDAQIAAAEEFVAAVKAGDGAAVVKAFQGMSAACKDY